MSCADPNLFNIPRPETPEGKMARDCFAAPDDDHELLQFDFSQLELRVAAMESDDPLMKQIFIDGDDYHKRTALMVSEMAWNIKPENLVLESNKDLLKKCRSEAKTINFGILYGMGAWTLAAKIGCEPEQAERTMMAIMGRFKKLKRYAQQQLMDARRTGYVWTTWANELFRRRPMWRIADRDDASKSRAERGTLNTPIQGKAADFCLWSLIECVNWILEERIEKKVKLVLTVYDSIMFEVHKSMSEEVLYTVPKIMLQWPANGVPLVVDAERGMSWGSLEKVGSFTSTK
jgi:DNA polymerase-1